MPTITPAEIVRIRLEIKESDEVRRDAARPATLTIENNSEELLAITGVKHLFPIGVDLIATSDSYLQREQTYSDLTQELRLLIQDEYFFSNPDLIAARKSEIIKLINEAIVAAPGPGLLHNIFRIWQVLLSPILSLAAFRRWQDRYNAQQLTIQGYQDAVNVWKFVVKLSVSDQPGHARNRELIELKLRQLEELDGERNLQIHGRSQWTIDPHSSHTESLIIRCKKSVLSVRRYPIVIEVSGTTLQAKQQITKRVSSWIEVPPRDLSLAIIAMLVAPIGAISRLVIQKTDTLFTALASQVGVSQIIVSSVLGLILCMAFERIRWGNSAYLKLSLHTAILLGFGAGVGAENLLKAIQAFFGIT